MGYQSFGDERGDSDSAAKLAVLDLPVDMRAKRFLDIGCNEGFFCLEAIRRGAAQAVGVDMDAAVLERARARAAGLPVLYQNSSWWQLPEGPFDVILMSSALHYEPRPKAFLAEVARRLAPDGLFVLEAGVYANSDEKMWVDVQRHDGALRFPTRRMLVEDILQSMAVRYIGPSVSQAGDPLGRQVFHCWARRPTAVVLSGGSGEGKTYLTSLLTVRSGAARVDHDHVLALIAKDEFSSRDPLVRKIVERFQVDKIYRLVAELVAEGEGEAYGRLLAKFVPSENDLVVVEGFGFLFPQVMDAFVSELQARRFVIWRAERAGLRPDAE